MIKGEQLTAKLQKKRKMNAIYFPSIEKSYIFAVQKISNNKPFKKIQK